MPLKTLLVLLITALCLSGCQSSDHAWPGKTDERDLAFIVPVIRLMDEDHEQRKANNLAVEEKLEAVVVIPQKTITLEETFDLIRDATGAQIAVNWPALELNAIEQDTPLLLGVTHLSGDYLLRLTLDYVSADAFDDDKAGFSLKDGVVLISTLRDLKSETNTSVYDVGWYLLPNDPMKWWLYRNNPRAKQLAEITRHRNDILTSQVVPGFDLNDALSGTSSGGSTRPQRNNVDKKRITLFSGPEEEKINHHVDELIEMIQITVGDPDEWLDEESTISVFKNNLVIKTTRENHLEIEALLAGLYKSQAEAFINQARLIEVYLLLDEAEAYRLKQQYPQALSMIKKALRVDPGNAEAWALHQVVTETMSR